MIEDFGNEKYILCGDFNMIFYPKLDCDNYKNINNPNARNKVLEYKNDFGIIDTYREMNPDTKRFTWRRRNPHKQARLDYILIADSLLPSLTSSTIEPVYRSDHSFSVINLSFNNFKRSKGLWKFNNSLLFDSKFLNLIKLTIDNIKLQYPIPVYNINNINSVPLKDIDFTINDQLILETLMMEIRGKSIAYSSHIKKTSNQRENTLIKEIRSLEKLRS